MRLRQKLLQEVRRLAAQARKTLLRLRLGNRWERAGGAFSRRQYASYDDYVAHQRNKLDAFRDSSIARHDRRFFEALSERLVTAGVPLRRHAVLCLAARQGSEVRAFIAQGAFAVGIDLNPGPGNRYVLPGDFHDLQFADGSADVIYTNSLDHAFDPRRLLAEVHRVLAPDGLLIAEVSRGEAAEVGRGFYESFSWAGLDDLIRLLESAGFRLEAQEPFSYPWSGEQLRLRRTA